jgi:hypothetical protein
MSVRTVENHCADTGQKLCVSAVRKPILASLRPLILKALSSCEPAAAIGDPDCIPVAPDRAKRTLTVVIITSHGRITGCVKPKSGENLPRVFPATFSGKIISQKCLILLARRKGFEPLTPRFEVWCY